MTRPYCFKQPLVWPHQTDRRDFQDLTELLQTFDQRIHEYLVSTPERRETLQSEMEILRERLKKTVASFHN